MLILLTRLLFVSDFVKQGFKIGLN